MVQQDKVRLVSPNKIECEDADATKNGNKKIIKRSLVLKGENNTRTAMAKAVGLPLGIAAKLILQKKITLTGLHIPIVSEIYEPVLKELEEHGIKFNETNLVK